MRATRVLLILSIEALIFACGKDEHPGPINGSGGAAGTPATGGSAGMDASVSDGALGCVDEHTQIFLGKTTSCGCEFCIPGEGCNKSPCSTPADCKPGCECVPIGTTMTCAVPIPDF